MAFNRVAALLAALCLALGLDATPVSAATSDNLCGGLAAEGGDNFPREAAIVEAARLAEQRLRQASVADERLEEIFAVLELAPATNLAPAPGALAHYCSAAGEAMRRSSIGSQYQAQLFLILAFRQAKSAGLVPVMAQAAYRFGLATAASPISPGVRGGRGRRRGSSEALTDQAWPTSGGDPCAELHDTDWEAARLEAARLEAENLETRLNIRLPTLALQCAAATASRSGDVALSALAGLRLARLRLAWSDTYVDDADNLLRDAQETALSAVSEAGRVEDPELRVELLGRLIGTALDLEAGRDPRMLSAVHALRSDRGAGRSTAGIAAALEARLAIANRDLAAARSLIEQAIFSESQSPLPARLPGYYLLLAQADPANRFAHISTAYTTLENLRPMLPRFDPLTEETSFSLYMREVFESAAEVQLGRAAAESGDHVRAAQEIVEAFRQAELQSAFGSECLPPREPLRPQDLRPGEIVLYPILLADRIELLYLSGNEAGQGGASYRRLASNNTAGRRDVTRLVRQMVHSMIAGEYRRVPAQQLYQLLIAPIEDQLAPDAMLVIVPDGPLRALPFAALRAADGQFLIQKTRLGVAPALAYLQSGTGERERSPRVVAASLRQEMRLTVGGFPRLDHAVGEALVAADSGSPGIHLPEFRKADLVDALEAGNVDILHLVTHAAFNGRSDRAFIVANGDVIRLHELREMIERNRTRGDELDLLVLSACETAVGDDEASMGLAGATVQAGVTTAIASLWAVDDARTATLMRHFYERSRSGRSRSEAIRDAQLALIEAGGDDEHPYYWAAFQLIGAWR